MVGVLIESALRITALMAAVAIGVRVLRVAAPRSAHRAWTGVCVVMLALPAVVAWAPRAMVPILSATDVPVHQSLSEGSGIALPAASLDTPSFRQPSMVWWPTIVAAIYSTGLVVLLAGVARGWWHSRTLRREARLVGGRWTHARCIAPMTVGVWRPVVILPPDWTTWDELDLGAVLAHEEEHARRRDPLVALLALVNRAVFWFHPLAWWLRRRLAMLSEQACDAVVMSGGHDAERYASVLVRFARAVSTAGGRRASPVVGMAAVGLPARLDLLYAPAARPASRPQRVWRAVAYVTAAAACAIATPTRAQSPALSPGQEASGWRTYASEHFDVRYLADQQTRIEEVAATAEQAYARLANRLKYELVQPVSLILVQRNDDIRAGAALSREVNQRDGTGRRHIVMSIQYLEQVPDAMVHELSHLFTFEIAPNARAWQPWLMEGLAAHQANQWNDRKVATLRTAVLASGVPIPERFPDDEALWGQVLFDYVVSQSGDEGVRRLLFALRTRPKLSAAIETAFGVEADAFYRGYADYAWNRFGPR
jgi:hypothetical protein